MSTISVSGRSGAKRRRRNKEETLKTPETRVVATFDIPSLPIQQSIFEYVSKAKQQQTTELKCAFSFSKNNQIIGKVDTTNTSLMIQILTFLQMKGISPHIMVSPATTNTKDNEDQAQQIVCGTVTGSTSAPKEPSCVEELNREPGVLHHPPVNIPAYGHCPSVAMAKNKVRALSVVGHFDSPSASDHELSQDEQLEGSDGVEYSILSERSDSNNVLGLKDIQRLLLYYANHNPDNLSFKRGGYKTYKPKRPPSSVLASQQSAQQTNAREVIINQNLEFATFVAMMPSLDYMHELPFMPIFPEVVESIQSEEQKPKTFSQIVYVKGIEKGKLTIQQICNLFECFGDVEIGMMHTKKEYAMVKFSCATGARNCIKELYGKEIGGKSLLIHFSELETLVPKFYTNEKIYHTPNNELKQFQAPKRSNHISRTLLVNFCPCFAPPGLTSKILSLEEAKRLLSAKMGQATLRSEGTPNEFYLEFSCTKSAVEYVMNNNYVEYAENSLFAMYTFATKSKWF